MVNTKIKIDWTEEKIEEIKKIFEDFINNPEDTPSNLVQSLLNLVVD